MKKIILFLIVFLGFYQGVFAFDPVSSPTSEQTGKGSGYTVGFIMKSPEYPCYISYPIYQLYYSGVTVIDLTNYTCAQNYGDNSFQIIHMDSLGLDGRDLVIVNSSTTGIEYVVFNKYTKNVEHYFISNYVFYDSIHQLITIPNGSNLDTYNSTASGSSHTWAVHTSTPKPNSGFGAMARTMPVYLYGTNGQYGYAYQGTDGKSYKVGENFPVGTDTPLTDNGTGIVLPLGRLKYNDIILASRSGGGLYEGDVSNISSPNFQTASGNILTNFNIFENPIAYFQTSGGVVKWDMNCMTPGYDSCGNFGGTLKCENSFGVQSPGLETCGGTVSSTPSTPSTPTTPTCFDGIKNQDETSIDFGGVCGAHPYSFSGFLCTDTITPIPPNVGSGGLNFANLPTMTIGSEDINSVSYTFSSGTTEEHDFRAIGIGTGTLINSGSLKSISAGIDTTISFDNSGSNGLLFTIYKNGGFHLLSYIAFNTGKNTLNQGQVNFLDINGNIVDHSYLRGIGGGIAIGYTDRTDIYGFLINGTVKIFDFYGLEIGLSYNSAKLTSCDNTEWSCKNNGTTCMPQYYYGNAQGTCGFIGDKCLPTTTLENADWTNAKPNLSYPASTYSSGNTYKPPTDAKGDLYTGVDIFSCTDESGQPLTGFSVLSCPFIIIGKIWSSFSSFMKTIANLLYGISSIASPAGHGNLFGFIQTANATDYGENLISPFQHDVTRSGGPGGIVIGGPSPDYANTYTGKDMAGLNHAIFSAGDNVKNLDRGGVKGLWAWSQWFLILIGLLAIVVVPVGMINK